MYLPEFITSLQICKLFHWITNWIAFKLNYTLLKLYEDDCCSIPFMAIVVFVVIVIGGGGSGEWLSWNLARSLVPLSYYLTLNDWMYRVYSSLHSVQFACLVCVCVCALGRICKHNLISICFVPMQMNQSVITAIAIITT